MRTKTKDDLNLDVKSFDTCRFQLQTPVIWPTDGKMAARNGNILYVNPRSA